MPFAIRRAAGVFRTRDALDLRRQRRDTRVARRDRLARAPRAADAEAPHRDPRHDQLVGGSRRGRQGRGVELGERPLGFVEAPNQDEAPDLEIPRVRGVHPIAMRFERRPRRVERLRGPARVARDERLGLGDDALARPASFGPKARSTPKKRLRSNEIAQLGHRDASKVPARPRRRARDSLQRAGSPPRGHCALQQ